MSLSLPFETFMTHALGSVRVATLFMAAPIFGHMAVSRQVRMALAVAVLIGIAPEPAPGAALADAPLLTLAGAVLREVLLGAAIGFATRILFGAFSLFGEIISVESGLSAARVLDPNTGASSVALASLFDLFIIGLFFIAGGHHLMVQTLARSFEIWPVGGVAVASSVFAGVAQLGAPLFEIAVRLAMPIVVAMMVSNLALGILARSVPQLNLMMLQLPAHVALGLALLSFGAGTFLRASHGEIQHWAERVLRILGGA